MGNHEQHQHFIVPAKYYISTYIALLVLTVLTVVVAQFHFGAANLLVAMVVAVAKAALVVFIFMGMKWESGFNRVAFLGSLFFLLLFFIFAFSDLLLRGYRAPVEAQQFGIKSPVKLVKPGESAGH